MGLDVAAGDSDVAAVRDFADEGWQQLRRMLQVGINYAQQVGIGVGPSERDSPGPILVGPVRTETRTRVRDWRKRPGPLHDFYVARVESGRTWFVRRACDGVWRP